MKLSILVCSIPERLNMFNTIQRLDAMCQAFDDVELIYLGDNRAMSIGHKRNLLINASCGDYVVFVDDDDYVDLHYIELIREAIINHSPDVVTFNAQYFENGKYMGDVDYDICHVKDSNESNLFKRIPNHLCPVRRELAEVTPYKDSSFGEDADYAIRLKKVTKSQYKIPVYLYRYDYNSKTSRSGKN